MPPTSWLNRRGAVRVEVLVGIRSTGWSDPGFVGGPPEVCREPTGEEEREIMYVQIGDEIFSDQHRLVAFCVLMKLLQPAVDDVAEDEVVWDEGDE